MSPVLLRSRFRVLFSQYPKDTTTDQPESRIPSFQGTEEGLPEFPPQVSSQSLGNYHHPRQEQCTFQFLMVRNVRVVKQIPQENIEAFNFSF